MKVTMSRLILLLIYCVLFTATHAQKFDKIVCVGDFHGDLRQALDVLKHSGVISVQADFYKNHILEEAKKKIFGGKGKNDEDGAVDHDKLNKGMVDNRRAGLMMGSTAGSHHWAGGKTLLVSTGDAMDVGPDDLEILYLFQRLEREARADGGKVVFLLGNHEMLNLDSSFQGVHPWSFEKSGGHHGRTLLLSEKSDFGAWLRRRGVTFQYDGLLLVHGGYFPKSVTTINAAMSGSKPDDLSTWVTTINKRVSASLQRDDESDSLANIFTNVNYKQNGDVNPLLIHPLKECHEVISANEMMKGVESQVVGHTPHSLPHYNYCNGSLYALDFKMSKWKAGQSAVPGYLVFSKGTDGSDKEFRKKWDASLVVLPPASEVDKQTSELFGYKWWLSVAACVMLFELIMHFMKKKIWNNTISKSNSNTADDDSGEDQRLAVNTAMYGATGRT